MKIPMLGTKQFVDKNGYLMPDVKFMFDQLFKQLNDNVSEEGFFISQQSAANITTLSTAQSISSILYDSTNNLFKGCVPNGSGGGVYKTFAFSGGAELFSDITLNPQASAPAIPAEGMMYVNSSAGNHLYIYLNGSWNMII